MAAKPLLVLLFVLPFARARQNSTRQLRYGSLSPPVPKLLVLLGSQRNDCQCTFEDTCSCQGALRFMDCVKNACNSGHCQCLEEDGTNHFSQSCTTLATECADVGLKCTEEQATCQKEGVAWHSKVKHHTVEKAVEEKQADEEKDSTADKAAKAPHKYVLHTKYKDAKKALHSHSHRVFAQGIIATLVVLSLTVALTSSSNELIAKQTWSVIDAVVVTFLALSWFIVVTYGLAYFNLTGYAAIAVHMLISVAFLVASVFISYSLKDNERAAAVFNGIFTPMVMWCNAGFVETVQKNFKSSAWLLLLCHLILIIWYAVLSVVFFYAIAPKEREWGDETKNHMAGGALAGGFILIMHMVISGSYQTIEDPHPNPPSFAETMIMLGVSLLYLVIAVVCTPSLTKLQRNSTNYWKGRAYGTLLAFVGVLPYFSIALSLGHLIVDNMGYAPGDARARLLLAMVNTFIGFLTIFICAYVPFFKRDTETAKQLSGVLIGLGGFIVGAAWAGLLDNSINMMVQGKGYAHPFVYKFAIVAFLTAFIFPVYYHHLKPVIMSKA